MRAAINRLIERIINRLELGEYISLDCRDGVHDYLCSCSCKCHRRNARQYRHA